MKVSDYIVEFLINKGIKDVFGYPGGMVTHLMKSFSEKSEQIHAHVNYHEQASAFCACAYAQSTGKPGVAYATSGPGATNLITGIANAYFDSIPVIFLTGQVNTFEAKGDLKVRQRGFQETDILTMVKSITKYCAYVSKGEDIRYELEKAWYYANEGRKGPVLLDLPMDIQKCDVIEEKLRGFEIGNVNISKSKNWIDSFQMLLAKSKRPVLLIGNGVKITQMEEEVRTWVKSWKIPVVSSMLAFDVFEREEDNYFGFIGAYGDRAANFVVAKSDLIISLGSRLDIRQVGAKTENFASNAKLIRVDIDTGEFTRKVKQDELEIKCDIKEFLKDVKQIWHDPDVMDQWLQTCKLIKKSLDNYDVCKVNTLLSHFSKNLPKNIFITTDVGQNQVWIAQSFRIKKNQKVLFSGGHGAMGYSLPAAIGACYGSNSPVVSFNGDGGIQMNIQELQFIARERLPITIVILNNSSLGMIRHFQEMYFESDYFQTVEKGGYTVPNFEKISYAYGLDYFRICNKDDIEKYVFNSKTPNVVEICLEEETYVFPKLEFGKPNQDQEPLLDRKLYYYLMDL